MKKANISDGFVKCFFMNLLLHFGWGILSLVLFVLHLIWDLPGFLAYLSSLVWGVEALVLTLMVSWGNQCGNQKPKVQQKNKNPYSVQPTRQDDSGEKES